MNAAVRSAAASDPVAWLPGRDRRRVAEREAIGALSAIAPGSSIVRYLLIGKGAAIAHNHRRCDVSLELALLGR